MVTESRIPDNQIVVYTPPAHLARPVVYVIVPIVRSSRRLLCAAAFVLAFVLAVAIVSFYPNTPAYHGLAALLACLVAVPFWLLRRTS